MAPNNWIEREEDSIQRDYDEGLISSAEAQAALRDLRDEIHAAAQEEADQAYDNYMDRF